MRLALALVLAFASLPACSAHDRGRTSEAPTAPDHAFPVSVIVEHPDGPQYPMVTHGGATFVAGEHGSRYTLRLVNRSARRIEAVVSVDGRDVVTGDPGDFKTQRGYVIEPFGSITVDGFRQSLDHVAAFRFTDHGNSYATRRGDGRNVGVIGVALFEERRSRQQRNRSAFAVAPPSPSHSPAPPPTSSQESAAHDAKRQAPAADFDASAAPESEAAAPLSTGAGSSRFAPPAGGELGTQYAETMFSRVHEVEFKRRKKRQPDVVFALHYDSPQGLAARGVPPFGSPVVTLAADPFPGR